MPQSTHSAVSRCEGICIFIPKDSQQLPGNNTSTLYLVTSADRKLSETSELHNESREEREKNAQSNTGLKWANCGDMTHDNVFQRCYVLKSIQKILNWRVFKQCFRKGWNCASHPGQEHQTNALWRRLICSALILSKVSLWHLTFIPDNRKPNFLHQAHTKREKSDKQQTFLKKEKRAWRHGPLTWH